MSTEGHSIRVRASFFPFRGPKSGVNLQDMNFAMKAASKGRLRDAGMR